MLKKISNWTFGSIFRTIGRFIAYIIIGVLISLLFIKKDYVKASEWESVWIPQTVKYQINNSTWNNTSLSSDYFHTISLQEGTAKYRFLFTSQKTLTNADDAMYFNVKIHMRDDTTIVIDDNGNYNQVCKIGYNQWPSTGEYYQDTFMCSFDMTGELWETKYSANFSYRYNVNGTVYYKPCFPYSNVGETFTFKCPVSSNAIDGVEVSIGSTTNTGQYDLGIYYLYNIEKSEASQIIDNQNQNHQQQMDYFNSTISGEVNGTGENGTITDEDAESASCGIICKLKHLIKMLSIDNIKYLVIPTEEQMNDLFEQMQTKVTSKLGILGLPITVYTRLMQIAMQYDDSQSNWCLQWDNVPVPNFEEYNIIQGGQWCFSDILQNQKINTFRTVCITIIGGLILLSFIQYLFNCLHRILDVPIQDNYEYFTVEDVTTMDPVTGEVRGRQHKVRRTQKLEVDE